MSMLMSEAAHLYLSQRTTEGHSPATIDLYTCQLRCLIAAMGDRPLGDVTLALLREHVAGYAPGHKAATVALRVRVICSFFRWSVEEEHLVRSPAMKLREPRVPDSVPKALSLEEVEAVRDACRPGLERTLVEFLFSTGARISEAVGLNRNTINWDRQCVVVMGKGGKEREVYLGGRALIWLRKYLGARKDADVALFVTERGAHRLTKHEADYIFRRIARRAGLTGRLTPHVMRHTFATMMLNAGAPLHLVQVLLGHSKPSTTERYARLSGEARAQGHRRYFVQ